MAQALVSGVLGLALSLGVTGAPAQTPGADVSADAAAKPSPADPPRRDRGRRRDAEAAAPTQAPPAVATSAAPAVAAAAEPAAETAEAKLVCKSVKPTGTKVARRICGTPEQWATMERRTTNDAQEGMRQIRDRTSVVVSQPESPLAGPN